MFLLSRDEQYPIRVVHTKVWYNFRGLLQECPGGLAWGLSDLDEGHGSAGLSNAGAQFIHAVLDSTQDFGLLGLWMGLCEPGV